MYVKRKQGKKSREQFLFSSFYFQISQKKWHFKIIFSYLIVFFLPNCHNYITTDTYLAFIAPHEKYFGAVENLWTFLYVLENIICGIITKF